MGRYTSTRQPIPQTRPRSRALSVRTAPAHLGLLPALMPSVRYILPAILRQRRGCMLMILAGVSVRPRFRYSSIKTLVDRTGRPIGRCIRKTWPNPISLASLVSAPRHPSGRSLSPLPQAPNSLSSTPQAVATPGPSARLPIVCTSQQVRQQQHPLSLLSPSTAPPALPPSAQLQRQHSPVDSTSRASISPQLRQAHSASISPEVASP